MAGLDSNTINNLLKNTMPYEALHLNAVMYSSEGFITPMITVEVAIRSGWV